MIFDEPFEGLDKDLRNEIVKLIKEYNNNIVIIIDHTDTTNEMFDNINVINL